MKNLQLLCIGFAGLAAVACSDNASDRPAMDGGDILLGATADGMQTNSRTVAVPYLPHEAPALAAEVWFRNHDGLYDHNPDATTGLPVHTDVVFNGSQMEYVSYGGERLKYPSGNVVIHCVGMYPATADAAPDKGWKREIGDDGKEYASHAIDGEQDLMFAKEIEGSWTNHFPTQTYRHLLTWIKINICASAHEAIEAWGKITQITVNSASEVKVDLKSATGEAQYTGPEQLIETIPAGGGLVLTTANKEVGSVFCSPKTTYTVTVTAVNNNGETITKTTELNLNKIIIDGNNNEHFAPITNWNDAVGNCFVFSLYFTPYDVVEGVTTLNSWSDQNEDFYLK